MTYVSHHMQFWMVFLDSLTCLLRRGDMYLRELFLHKSCTICKPWQAVCVATHCNEAHFLASETRNVFWTAARENETRRQTVRLPIYGHGLDRAVQAELGMGRRASNLAKAEARIARQFGVSQSIPLYFISLTVTTTIPARHESANLLSFS